MNRQEKVMIGIYHLPAIKCLRDEYAIDRDSLKCQGWKDFFYECEIIELNNVEECLKITRKEIDEND